MSEKVIVILADGMRQDAPEACGNPYVAEFSKKAKYLKSTTVMPSITLPCHLSLFHSVAPQRHGILTNTYVPQVRPVEGLVERLNAAGKKCAFYYSWDPLRDLARPLGLSFNMFCEHHAYDEVDKLLSAEAVTRALRGEHDFIFLYLVEPDVQGHAHGFTSPEYLQAVSMEWDCIRTVTEALDGKFQIIVTADHGGHDRTHGYDVPEDMNIPIYLRGSVFSGCTAETANIIDIAPTVAKIMGAEPSPDWDGKALPGVG